MNDPQNMRQLLNKMSWADEGLSKSQMKLNEDIQQLVESGEEVFRRIKDGALSGKVIGGYNFVVSEPGYDPESNAGYEFFGDTTSVANTPGKYYAATMVDPEEQNMTETEVDVSVKGHVEFGPAETGFVAYGGVTITVDERGQEEIEDIKGEGNAPLAALKSFLSNVQTAIDDTVANMSAPDYDDSW